MSKAEAHKTKKNSALFVFELAFAGFFAIEKLIVFRFVIVSEGNEDDTAKDHKQLDQKGNQWAKGIHPNQKAVIEGNEVECQAQKAEDKEAEA
jgi:hypothetical protein